MSQSESDDVLYITLIDFLLQLLFLGMVVSVIYAITQKEEPEQINQQKMDAVENMENIKRLTGISDLTVLTDELTRLGPLQPVANYSKLGREIEKQVNDVGGLENAQKILTAYSDKRGQGKPSCLNGGAKLAVFHAYPNKIELQQPVTSDMLQLLNRINLKTNSVLQLSLTEFRAIFGIVKRVEPNCRYNVELVEHSFDTRPRDAVRSAFVTMWLSHAVIEAETKTAH